MKTDQIVMCVVALLLGMLLANMLQNVCGCKVVEGLEGEEGEGRCQPENWGCGENAGAGPDLPTTPNWCYGVTGGSGGECNSPGFKNLPCNCSGTDPMTAAPVTAVGVSDNAADSPTTTPEDDNATDSPTTTPVGGLPVVTVT